jgi:hypothetical protein
MPKDKPIIIDWKKIKAKKPKKESWLIPIFIILGLLASFVAVLMICGGLVQYDF